MTILRFMGSVWGWLLIALITSSCALVILVSRENERADFNLRVWNGVKTDQTKQP